MENKKPNFSKNNSKACQSSEFNRKFSDIQLNKPWIRNSGRRENSNGSKSEQQQRNNKQQSTQVVRPNVDKRPRPRGGGGDNGYQSSRAASTRDNTVNAACTGLASDEATTSHHGNADALGSDYQGAVRKYVTQTKHELNSVYTPGGKKRNLNHLLNFHYASKEFDYGINVFGRGGAGTGRIMLGKNKKSKYNKEQFLQANFQFAVKPIAKSKLFASPDTLIDWDLIEQINVQTTEEPQCPICLYPPIAAKMTRCGHAYCWPCILHYLALTDKTWRKCPICYEAVHTNDLKSTLIVQQQPIMTGDHVTFQLMRRKKGNNVFIERHTSLFEGGFNSEYFPGLSSTDGKAKLFSKFLIAYRSDIADIIERERLELLADKDPNCPEFIFVQQALDMLKERRRNLDIANDEEYEKVETKTLITEYQLVNKTENVTVDSVSPNLIEDKDTEQKQEKYSLNQENLENIKYYYFYQSIDGQNIFLHPLNVKMLQAHYGSLSQAPLLIDGCVLQKEYHSMDEEHRRKYTCLAHLPLTCQFSIVEIDLKPPHITEDILQLFAEDILNRKKERQRRDREERKRERKIDELNNRQMGKLVSSTAKLNLGSSSEFPSCGLDYGPALIDEVELAPQSDAPTTASYSLVTVAGDAAETNNFNLWPGLASSPIANDSRNDQKSSHAWGKSKAIPIPSSSNVRHNSVKNEISDDSDNIKSVSPLVTNLGDVLAEALCQKKQGGSVEKTERGNEHFLNISSGNKKHKKSKKMQPLFSTGMNYSGK